MTLSLPPITPVTLLTKEGLIKPFDRDRIDSFDAIDPLLLGHDYDPDSRFAIPFQWEILVLELIKLF